ncbi:hypothetical protein JMJ77_0003422 [Colletotrichum scovillei]|uniref:Uncharacterized protein n=1 Tax=Colletotrichum scovillei TaxID=1209932 RepID=A0A9P7QQT1_9PEZI|nr:hypothetical protein JMJ78_0004930 [Colletotrichum scovillei]KAG7041315.1 hypothetical protein JMJ77_0003422 [Colletotrichum scovillei]KAG7061344.1 hypothetical protein JMJ76_0000909 [Colletotrichum scovillei]
MQSRILLLMLTLGRTMAQVTCARAHLPNTDPYGETTFRNVGPRYEAGCATDLVVHYAPPSRGTKNGVLSIYTTGQSFRSIIEVNGPVRGSELAVEDSTFWIDSASSCKTSFPAIEPKSITCYRA